MENLDNVVETQKASTDDTIENSIYKYHYELNGKNIGPITKNQLEELIKNRTLGSESLIWRKGFQDWKKIKDTELYQHYFGGSPPPITGHNINNTFIWILACAPIIGLVIEMNFFQGKDQNLIFFLYFILNSGFAILDDIKLKNAGHKTNNLGWAIFLIPVYLWKRANLTRQSKSYFWLWIVLLLISIGVSEGNNSELNSQANSYKEETVPETTPRQVSSEEASKEYSEDDKQAINKLKAKVKSDYPEDYILQEAVYDQNVKDYFYMKYVQNVEIKSKVEKDYPNDYILQKAVYDEEVKSQGKME